MIEHIESGAYYLLDALQSVPGVGAETIQRGLDLYHRLAADDALTAHSRFNALIRRLVSFERAAACAG
ncbi:MAG: hypothetical protein ABI024_13900 [Vicinamibacterales bacterium]